jgi:hypothetical protein
MQRLFKIVNGGERCLCYVQRYGKEEVMGCNKNKCKVNKTKKMKPVSKKPKIGPSCFEKWHGTHQKTQAIFENKNSNRCTKQTKK